MKKLDEAKWAVLFISKKKENSSPGYNAKMNRLVEKVKALPGFLHLQTFINEKGEAIAISYWKDHESISKWGSDPEHIEAQKRGIIEWYDRYQIFVTKVEDYYDYKL